METLAIFFSIFCFFLAIALFAIKRSRELEIPGPGLVDITRSFLQLEFKDIFRVLSKWSVKYGKVYAIDLLIRRIIVVGDLKITKQWMSLEELTGRPAAAKPFEIYEDGVKHGVGISDGPHWKELRSFYVSRLKEFGFHPKSWEKLIYEEISVFLEKMHAIIHASKTRNVVLGDWNTRFLIPLVNPVWFIFTGERASHDDLEMINAIKGIRTSFNSLISGFVFLLNYWLFRCFTMFGFLNTIRKPFHVLKAFTESTTKRKRQSYLKKGEVVENVVDAFLQKIQSTEEKNSAFYKETGERNLAAVLGNDVMMAVGQNTAAALEWVVLYVSALSDVQERIYLEINNSMKQKQERLVTLADRKKLPYASAVISETLRLRSIVPGVSSTPMLDVEVGGIKLRRGDHIFYNFRNIKKDDSVWSKAELFQPERHLKEDGSFFEHPNQIGFSSGRRRCPGEQMAKDTLFLWLANMLWNFKFALTEDSKNVGFEPLPGALIVPKPFQVLITPRGHGTSLN